jgi:hypothetical protein
LQHYTSRAQHQHTALRVTLPQCGDDQSRLNGFAHAHIIGDDMSKPPMSKDLLQQESLVRQRHRE